MLYLADWTHYREHLRPITGGQYVALQRGPVLDDYEKHFDRLERRGVLSKKEVPVHGHQEKPKSEYLALMEPDESVFSESELKVLSQVVREQGDYTGRMLSDRSHDENGVWSWAWNPAKPGQAIPYTLVRWMDNWCDDRDIDAAKAMLRDDPGIAAELKKLSR